MLWAEAPDPVALFRARHGFVGLVFFVVFFGFVLVASKSPSRTSWLFVLPAAFIFGSFIYDQFVPCWTLYGITTRRLVIVHPSLFSTVLESYYPMDIEFVKKTRRRGGAGNIVFAAVRERSGKRTETVEIGFFGVDAVDEVEARIVALRESWKPQQSTGAAPCQPAAVGERTPRGALQR